jgi:hypothetical protein
VRIKEGSISVRDISHQGMQSFPNRESDLKTMTRRGLGLYQDLASIITSLLKYGGITVSLSLDPQRDQNLQTVHLRVSYLFINQT